MQIDQWSQVSTWLSYADGDGHSATQFQFWDGDGSADSGYFWTSENPHQPANAPITVAAVDLDNVWLRSGAVAGPESMWVRAYDGTDWGEWDLFMLATNTPPSVAVDDQSLQQGEWSQVSGWVSFLDDDGNAATQYQFWDGGASADSGYFLTSSNTHHPAYTSVTVSANELDNTWLRGGTVAGSETMWVRVFDGSDWSAWDSFVLLTA